MSGLSTLTAAAHALYGRGFNHLPGWRGGIRGDFIKSTRGCFFGPLNQFARDMLISLIFEGVIIELGGFLSSAEGDVIAPAFH